MIEFTISSKVMYHHPQILTTFSILAILALRNAVGKCGQHLGFMLVGENNKILKVFSVVLKELSCLSKAFCTKF